MLEAESCRGKIMSDSAYVHVNNEPSIAAEVHDGISRGQARRPGTIASPAPTPPGIESQRVVDRLLRECFTRKPPGGTGRIDDP